LARPFKQEIVQLETTDEVVTPLFAAAPGAAEIVERLEAELPDTAERSCWTRCRSRSTAGARTKAGGSWPPAVFWGRILRYFGQGF
jgi:hypothetical protein